MPFIFTVTHLSSQCYSMCFRREAGFCALCLTTAITPIVGDIAPQANNAQTSFGLSITATGVTVAKQNQADGCISDYLIVPNFETGVGNTRPS